MSVNGLVVMTPTSIASTGTSASIGANGKVSFSSCSSLSLNGVFTNSYDNYMIVMRATIGVAWSLSARLRASGTDATAANYTFQYLYADGTSIVAARSSATNQFRVAYFSTPQRNGFAFYLFGPNLSQPTAARSVMASDYLSAYIDDNANTHSLSTAYDGITFFPGTSTITGEVTVYGFNQ